MSELAPTLPVVGDGGGYRGRGLAPVPVSLTIDGVRYALCVDPSMAGLKAIREYAGHERPRRGCQAGICGKCESRVDGNETRLCLTQIGDLDGTTIETPAPRKSMFAI